MGSIMLVSFEVKAVGFFLSVQLVTLTVVLT